MAQADPSYAVLKVGSPVVGKVGLWSGNLPENCGDSAGCHKIKAARAFFVMSTIEACKWNRGPINRRFITPSCSHHLVVAGVLLLYMTFQAAYPKVLYRVSVVLGRN